MHDVQVPQKLICWCLNYYRLILPSQDPPVDPVTREVPVTPVVTPVALPPRLDPRPRSTQTVPASPTVVAGANRALECTGATMTQCECEPRFPQSLTPFCTTTLT